MHQKFNKFHIWNKLATKKDGSRKIDYNYIWEPRIIELKCCREDGFNNREELDVKVVTLYGILNIKVVRSVCPFHDIFNCLILNKLFPATPINISMIINVR